MKHWLKTVTTSQDDPYSRFRMVYPEQEGRTVT